MKKITFFLLVIFLTFSLTACDPADFFYNYDELKQSVEIIQLINYKNPQAKELGWVGGYGGYNKRVAERLDSLLPFDFEKMEVLEVLSTEKADNFLQDIAKVHFFYYERHADSPNGMCIRMVYKNGDFEIIRISEIDGKDGYAGSFDAEGNIKRFIGAEVSSLENLTSYFETPLLNK